MKYFRISPDVEKYWNEIGFIPNVNDIPTWIYRENYYIENIINLLTEYKTENNITDEKVLTEINILIDRYYKSIEIFKDNNDDEYIYILKCERKDNDSPSICISESFEVLDKIARTRIKDSVIIKYGRTSKYIDEDEFDDFMPLCTPEEGRVSYSDGMISCVNIYIDEFGHIEDDIDFIHKYIETPIPFKELDVIMNMEDGNIYVIYPYNNEIKEDYDDSMILIEEIHEYSPNDNTYHYEHMNPLRFVYSNINKDIDAVQNAINVVKKYIENHK